MLNDLIERADTEAEDIHKAHHRITVTEAVTTGLEVIHGTAEGVGLFDLSRMSEEALLSHAQRARIMSGAARAGIALGLAGIAAQYISFWMQLGGAHAEAKAKIVREHLKNGMIIDYGGILRPAPENPELKAGKELLWQRQLPR